MSRQCAASAVRAWQASEVHAKEVCDAGHDTCGSGASGSSTMSTKVFVADGSLSQRSSGEMPSALQVYRGGIAPPTIRNDYNGCDVRRPKAMAHRSRRLSLKLGSNDLARPSWLRQDCDTRYLAC